MSHVGALSCLLIILMLTSTTEVHEQERNQGDALDSQDDNLGPNVSDLPSIERDSNLREHQDQGTLSERQTEVPTEHVSEDDPGQDTHGAVQLEKLEGARL
jgi:hypothetical protein